MTKRLTIIRIKGDPDELLKHKREVMDPVLMRKGPEHGGISHVTARADDGIVIVNLWESAEGSEAAFNDPEVEQARNSLQERVAAPPETTHYDVEFAFPDDDS